MKRESKMIIGLQQQNGALQAELDRTKYHSDTMIIGLQQQNGALQAELEELKEAEHRRLDYQQRAERDQDELRVKHGRLLELLVTLIALARGMHDNDLHIPGCPGLNLGEHCLCVWGRLDTFLKKLDREYQEKRGAGGLLAEVDALKKESLDEAAPIACRMLDCGRPVAPGSSWCHWHAGRL